MKNPKTNRTIGYIALFFGFWLWYKGFHHPMPEDPVNGKSPALIVLSIIIIVAAMAWSIAKVRCPHCGRLLHLKLYNINYCRHCGKSTDV